MGTDQPDSLPDVPVKRLELPNHTKEHNKISSAWLGTGTGPCLNIGPSRETETGTPSDECYAMDCTPDTLDEQILLSRLGPRRKPRRRSIPLRSYDRLVALAEANAQRKHDEAFGPSQGLRTHWQHRGET